MRSVRLLLLVLALGCNPFHSLGPTDIAGIYDLVLVNGEPLPHTGPLGDGTRTVTGGTLSLPLGFGSTGTLLTQFADQPDPSAADVQWFLHDGLLDLTFSAGGMAYPHPDSRWDDGNLFVTFSPADLLPAGTYRYRRRAG